MVSPRSFDRAAWGAVALAIGLGLGGCRRTETPEARPTETVDPIEGEELAAGAIAPVVPPPLARTHATKVILEIEVREQRGTLADGVEYPVFTYGGSIPGRFYRVREGDLVEVHLHNHPDNTLAHNIVFQSANGPGGGGDASYVSPGYSATFSWRATRPGLYLYQSTAAPAALHVASGMFGLLFVEPRHGMPKVDREFQIVQSEFYTEGKFGERGPTHFSAERALNEQPEYVLFNGRVDSLAGAHALQSRTGERIRIYFGNAGPNLPSSFHVSGALFDTVYGEGGVTSAAHDVQATAVPPGAATIVEFTPQVPGDYSIADHSLVRANSKGARGTLSVAGGDNRMLFTGMTAEAVYDPGTKLAKLIDPGRVAAGGGAAIFATVCATCHQASGQGIPKVFPPLRASDFLVADRNRSIRVVMSGLTGPIVVGGATYTGTMPNLGLSDEQIAEVLTYEMTNFDNKGKPVTVDEVARVRKSWDGKSPLAVSAVAAKSR